MNHARLPFLLALLTMIGALGIDTYLPAFHAIGLAFDAPPLAVQQTLGIYVACMSITMLFSGTLSDSFGRRRVLLVSLVGFTLTSAAAALATSIEMLIALRALQGLTAGAGMVVSRAMVQDLYKDAEAQRVMATVTMVFSVAPAVAPVLGGVLQAATGWRSIFVFLTLYGLLLWLLCQRALPETLPAAQRAAFRPREVLARYVESLRHPNFVLLALSIALVFGGVPLYIGSAASFIMTVLGKSETAFGWLFIPLIGGTLIGSWLAHRLARQVAPDTLQAAGLWLGLLAALVNVGYAAFWEVRLPYAVLPLMLYTLGMGLFLPVMMLRVLNIFAHMRGLAASMQSFVQMMTFSLISSFVAPLVMDSALAIAVAMLACMSAGLALLWLANRVATPPVQDRANA
ncbi:MAG: multidrug effflux MFS transporter [Comamonas sp.]